MAAALQLSGHEKDLGGGFVVRRLLPAARRRSVGPFVFFDHFGPVTERPEDNHDVRPHPHIGLATVTYLFEGAMMHRDSLGTAQRIKPDDLRGRPYVNHGLQLWVALPQEQEEAAPSFVHTSAGAIPEVDVEGAQVRVLVGDAFGVRSPVAPASPTLYLDIALPQGGTFELPPLASELAAYPVAGALSLDGEPMAQARMQVLEPGAAVRLQATGPARLVVVGGETLGPRYMYWNFVSSSKERILAASADWEAGRFPLVPGDDKENIPLPPTRFTPPEPMS